MTPPTLRRPPAPDHPVLRAEVAALRRREQRRIFPARLCVGPGSERWVSQELPWPPRDRLDEGLLFDLLDGLYDAGPRVGAHPGPPVGDRLTWLVRPGRPEPHDLDLRVAAVVERVRAAHGTPGAAGLVVLTRYGWLDPLTGASRTWKRLRVPAEQR